MNATTHYISTLHRPTRETVGIQTRTDEAWAVQAAETLSAEYGVTFFVVSHDEGGQLTRSHVRWVDARGRGTVSGPVGGRRMALTLISEAFEEGGVLA